ncbi:MAG TPA: cupin domain-containing protein [Symbiobacteriaceae bacterium]|jgi:quercetin dioxygenase-like cupin family protein|nr:cupin domain-containing protein [Symbiobacteriaceae bacterium]
MERISIPEVSVVSADRFTKRVCFNHPQVLVFVLTFAPGQALPPHRHPGSAVVLQVFAGSGTIAVDGQETPIKQGDAILVNGDEEMQVRNSGQETLTLYVTLSPNPTNPAFRKEIG